MASNAIEIELDFAWGKGNEVTPCTICGDLIVSGSNHLRMGFARKDGFVYKYQDTDVTLCNSCHDVVKEQIKC